MISAERLIMTKPTVREIIIVEGRYDKNTLSQAVNAVIIDVGGFSIYNDPEKLSYIRSMAEKNGAIILTDSDAAGFQIRKRLSDALNGIAVKHAYIPDIQGKERRKTAPSSAGTLGVEGMTGEQLIEALRRSGAAIDEEVLPSPVGCHITYSDLYAYGLAGSPNAALRREALCKHIGLPVRMGSKALLRALNLMFTADELSTLLMSQIFLPDKETDITESNIITNKSS